MEEGWESLGKQGSQGKAGHLDAAAATVESWRLPAHGTIGSHHDVHVQGNVKIPVVAAGAEPSQRESDPALRRPQPQETPPPRDPAHLPVLGKSLLVQEHNVRKPHGFSRDAE